MSSHQPSVRSTTRNDTRDEGRQKKKPKQEDKRLTTQARHETTKIDGHTVDKVIENLRAHLEGMRAGDFQHPNPTRDTSLAWLNHRREFPFTVPGRHWRETVQHIDQAVAASNNHLFELARKEGRNSIHGITLNRADANHPLVIDIHHENLVRDKNILAGNL